MDLFRALTRLVQYQRTVFLESLVEDARKAGNFRVEAYDPLSGYHTDGSEVKGDLVSTRFRRDIGVVESFSFSREEYPRITDFELMMENCKKHLVLALEAIWVDTTTE